MEIHEKGLADYRQVEEFIGAPFFTDAGRTAIAAQTFSEEARELASLNPVRSWMFGAAVSALVHDAAPDEPLVEGIRHRLQLINNLETYIARYEAGLSGSRLSEIQHDVFHDLATFMRGDDRFAHKTGLTKAGYIEMPTGTGKTVVFTELLKAFHADKQQPVKSLVLVPKKEILRQTVGEDGKRGFAEFAPGMYVTSYYSEEKDLSGEVVVMTYASFNRSVADGVIHSESFDVLICDEAHRALGSQTQQNIKDFSQDKVAIGLTATTDYADNKKVSQLFPEKIHSSRFREVVEQGILAPVQAWLYKTDIEVEGNMGHSDYTPAELAFLAQLEGRNRKAVEFAKGFVEQGMQGIISCLPGENVLHPRVIADMLNETEVIDPATGLSRTMHARAISGDMTMDIRNEYYRALEDGELDILTFVDTIAEGWDSRQAKFLINLRPTCSPVFGVQRLGRILRPDEAGTVAQVVDFIDTSKRAQFVALHALGEYRYILGKVFGNPQHDYGIDLRRIDLPEDLKDNIRRVHAIPVQNIILGRQYAPEYSDTVTMTTVAEEAGLSPLALIFVARDIGLDLRVEGDRGILDPTLVKIRDMTRETLLSAAADSKYEALTGLDDQLLETILNRQSDLLIQKFATQPEANASSRYRQEFADASGQDLARAILSRRVRYRELPLHARERLQTVELTTGDTARILLELDHRDNEPFRRAVFGRMVQDQANPGDILNYATQSGLIRNTRRTAWKDDKTGKITAKTAFVTADNREIEVKTSHDSTKSARMHTNFRALGQAAQLDDIGNMLAEALPTEPPKTSNARVGLHEFSQRIAGSRVETETEHVMGAGNNAVFSSTTRLVLSHGRILVGTGNASSKRAAEEVAAQEIIKQETFIALKQEQAAIAAAKVTTKKLPTSLEKQQLNNYFSGKNLPPVAMKTQEDKGRIGGVEYTWAQADDGGWVCTLTFSDQDGNQHRHESGSQRSKQIAKYQAARAALYAEPLVNHQPELLKIKQRFNP